jgi:zinc transport system substrate-binding protein
MEYRIILYLLLTSGLFSCNTSPAEKEKEILSVSIDPQKYFLETIVGDKYQVKSLITSGSNPESFDPSPAQMLAIGKSSTYFKVGHLSFEGVWLNKLKENNPSLNIVDCSTGIDIAPEHRVVTHDSHAGIDPHIWSSPKMALVMVKNMYETVVAFDSENEAFYGLNMITLLNEFATTDSIIKSYVANAPCKSFFIYHSALSYFADEYGLRQYCIEQDGKAPTPAQLKQSIDIAKGNNIRVVFIQAEYDRKNAETLANEIGAKVVSINLLSYEWSAELIKIAKSLSAVDE